MKNLIIISIDWQIYASRFKQDTNLLLGYKLLEANEKPSQANLLEAQVLLGEPDLLAKYIPDCPQLEWVQSTWAGNNKLQGIQKQDYVLSGVKGVFGQQMVEYVLSYLLYFSRRIEEFNHLKERQQWEQLRCSALSDYRVGIMGLGSIGKQVADKLLDMGIAVSALSNKTYIEPDSDVSEIIKRYPKNDLNGFLKSCNVVLNLLPETKETKGYCDRFFFETMPANSIFMNMGRGSLLDKPQSIIDALKSGHLKAAVLDVYDTEPLPSDHVFYQAPNLFISCHTAAISEPKQVFSLFTENAKRFIAGEKLLYTHDFRKGY